MSDYVRNVRSRIGHALLVLPGVTAVIRDDAGRYLLARHVAGDKWGFVGGSIEPLEQPRDALRREVREETGVEITIERVIDSYGGPALAATYPNGDRVSYITTAYLCRVDAEPRAAEVEEVAAAGWFDPGQISQLDRFEWIDLVVRDAELLTR